MKRFPISNSTYVQIFCVKYIPLHCRIWPDFVQKSSLFCQQSLGMIQTHAPIFLKSLYSLDDKIRTTVQLIIIIHIFIKEQVRLLKYIQTVCNLANCVDSLLKRMVQMVRQACWYPLSSTDPNNIGQIWKITCYV